MPSSTPATPTSGNFISAMRCRGKPVITFRSSSPSLWWPKMRSGMASRWTQSRQFAPTRSSPAIRLTCGWWPKPLTWTGERRRSSIPNWRRRAPPRKPSSGLRRRGAPAERFFAEIAATPPEKWVSWRRHRIEEGETLSAIARKYRVTPPAIADANSIDGRTPLHAGDKLIIPAAAHPQPVLGKLVHYRVRRGDTLDTIAEQFDVSVAELKRWNRLRGNRVSRGMSLKVYPGGRTPPSTAKSRRKGSGPEPSPSEGADPKPSGGAQSIFHHAKPSQPLGSNARAHRDRKKALFGQAFFGESATARWRFVDGFSAAVG